VGARPEKVRGDRHVGWNRGSAYYSQLYCPAFDFEIDTTMNSPEECAAKFRKEFEQIGNAIV
jgi:chloramphenicol 3-O-phosphotransferase